MKARDTVRLHPKTVSDYKAHVRKNPRRKSKTATINHVRVDIRVWRVAMELAGGDFTRLVVRSETEVSVLNPVFSKKYKENNAIR